MEPRPRIKLLLSPFDKTIEGLCIFLLAALWLSAIYFYWKMPQTIPIHFNAAGKPHSFGTKGSLLFLPFIGNLIYVGISALNKHPHVFNYLTPITTENAAEQYNIATRVLRFIKLVVLIIFISIVLYSYLSTIGAVGKEGRWFLPIILSFFLFPTVYMVVQLSRKKSSTNYCIQAQSAADAPAVSYFVA